MPAGNVAEVARKFTCLVTITCRYLPSIGDVTRKRHFYALDFGLPRLNEGTIGLGKSNVDSVNFIDCRRERELRRDVPLQTDFLVHIFFELKILGLVRDTSKLIARGRQMRNRVAYVERQVIRRLYDDAGSW